MSGTWLGPPTLELAIQWEPVVGLKGGLGPIDGGIAHSPLGYCIKQQQVRWDTCKVSTSDWMQALFSPKCLNWLFFQKSKKGKKKSISLDLRQSHITGSYMKIRPNFRSHLFRRVDNAKGFKTVKLATKQLFFFLGLKLKQPTRSFAALHT